MSMILFFGFTGFVVIFGLGFSAFVIRHHIKQYLLAKKQKS
jgi:hypothetical protein